MARLQAASALGQARLQSAWEEALGAHGIPAAQILLAAGDVADRTAYVNARQAFAELFRLGAVPVVNENDATATDEITFGDNDALAAQVAVLVRARLLVLLTEVEGVYSRAPGTPGAELLSEGELAGEAEIGVGTELGRGGMGSKVVAAQMASAAGIPTVIAGGLGDDVLGPILAGEARGTRFAADDRGETAFKLWLRFGKPVAGTAPRRRRSTPRSGRERGEPARGRHRSLRGEVRRRAQRSSSSVPTESSSERESRAPARTTSSGGPRGLEAVHRDRLVLY